MLKIKTIFFMLFILCMVLFGELLTIKNSKAQSLSTPTALTSTPTAIISTQVDANSPADEISVLHAQLEEMRFYDQRLLATVYWSLGTVVTLAILFAGFSWFTNFRLYERDKISLQRELSLEIDKLRSDVRALFAEQKNALSVAIEERISAQLQNEFTSISSRLDGLKLGLKRNKIDVESLEAAVWALRGVHENTITVYISALDEAISEDQSQYYASILNGILETVEHLNWITTHRMADLERLFNLLPKEHEPACNNIREKLKAKLK